MRRKRIPVELKDTKAVKLNQEDIEAVLRAADEIIYQSGRGMLVKILKGSKDKKLLEYGLDSCPSYGYFNHLTVKAIEPIVDWMIKMGYLTISYSGRLPFIVFDQKGWETYQPVYAKKLYQTIIKTKKENYETLAEEL